MRLYILLIGVFAGLLGMLGSLAALTLQLQQAATGDGEATFEPWLISLFLSTLGLYGARHALGRPMLSSTVMASAAVGGLLSVAWFSRCRRRYSGSPAPSPSSGATNHPIVQLTPDGARREPRSGSREPADGRQCTCP